MARLIYTTYTTSNTFTVPQAVTQVILFGRGGSAGGGSMAGGLATGGGGVYTTMQVVPVTPNTMFSITIGTAGTGGTVGSAGTSGGDTTFGSLFTFKGAKGN